MQIWTEKPGGYLGLTYANFLAQDDKPLADMLEVS